MYLGMRDVLAHRKIGDDYSVFTSLGITAMEVRTEPNLALQFLGDTPFSIADADSKKTLFDHMQAKGVEIKGILLCNPFDGSEEEIRWVRESARFASELGIASMRVDCWREDPGNAAGRAALQKELTPVFETLLDAAGEFGVKLALENHGPWTNQPEVMAALLDQFGSRGLSLCLDTGNFYVTGHLPLSQVYQTIERLAPHITTAHMKNGSYPEDVRETRRNPEKYPFQKHAALIEKGDIDHTRIFGILKDAGYDGPLFYEDEALYGLQEGIDKAAAMAKTMMVLKDELDAVNEQGDS
jgi:sugar phosphate isomerase/epimerase